MADEPQVLYAQQIHFTVEPTTPLVTMAEAAEAAPPGTATELDGIMECSVSEAADSVDTNYYGSDGYKTNAATLTALSVTVSGHRIKDNAAQNALEGQLRRIGYLHVIRDADATAGQRGKRYKVRVMSFESGGPSSDVDKLTVSLTGQGAPVAV
ncbi:hypothetical protein D7V97_36975 [Corallococcus sp. CA053C]|uniref:phage tail tube protein n=1 Tax=Corallococcus sp. CA053C TaxID=2316732 RepID=UPI000EA00EEB|nr:hypothetical protein [Corallococcus sp. CA053C]RKG95569.1 hypothetical protein D7V97_36975 [Corallococcus sp. CA053C]